MKKRLGVNIDHVATLRNARGEKHPDPYTVVAYLIPIFGVILGYLFLNELVTSKILISLFIVILGIYFVKKSGDKKIEGI